MTNNYANRVYIHRIGKELKKQGYEVHVMAYLEDGLQVEEEIEGILVHRVNPCFYKMKDCKYEYVDSWKGNFKIFMMKTVYHTLSCNENTVQLRNAVFIRWTNK